MRYVRSLWRPAVALIVLAVVVIAVTRNAGGVSRVMPGSFTGYGFDACDAPSQRVMDAWHQESPYAGIGIYIAGSNRACSTQPNLDADWVRAQSDNGWRLLPITVGLQSACYDVPGKRVPRISNNAAGSYAAARGQGRDQADATIGASQDLAIAEGSTLWYDLEHFDNSNARCRGAALAFLSGWTSQLHQLGYRSGVYSSASSGIRLVNQARLDSASGHHLPDQVWFADWNRRRDVRSRQISSDAWAPHARVHQFLGPHDETHGGVTLNIDSDFLDVGHGSTAPPPPRSCGVSIDFRRYRPQGTGDSGGQVAAAQCLLRQANVYSGPVDGRYDARTASAVRHFQSTRPPLHATGSLDRGTWTVLLSEGSTPVLKFGSAGDAVRRLQRALNATTGARLPVSGIYFGRTRAALTHYQRKQRLPDTGVTGTRTWVALQRGQG
jgi:peptidoglycan hydrolase-like protein with peptidoglycan-binding domain